MNPEIRKRRLAVQDIIEQSDYIAQDSINAADRFIQAAEEAFHLLAGNPRAGALRAYNAPALENIRMWPIRGFEKHLIFYREIPGGIEVIRVLYAARDIPSLFSKRSNRS